MSQFRQEIPLEQRFWSKVDQRGTDECWPWLARKNEHGYGEIQLGRRGGGAKLAHRVAFALRRHGFLEGIHGKCVLHSCDNPACCNPSHLFLGTQADNMRDMMQKGRYKAVNV